MGKALTLLLTILLALASGAGYLILTEKIAAGEKQIAEGERQLEQGRAALEEGRADLEAGKRVLGAAKEGSEALEDIPFVGKVDERLEGEVSEEVERRIAEGDEQVASGEDRIAVGKQRLEAGELELRRGKEKLRTARGIRVAVGVGAALFASLSIVLGFRWRRSLARTFTKTDS